MLPVLRLLSFWVLLALTPRAALVAQDPVGLTGADTGRVRGLDPVNVTATRTPQVGFQTPAPVTVIDSATARRQAAYSAADLFRLAPGVDLAGTGSNQHRLAIRGQRGQRILLMENGIRLNNARRQQDFGELPALVDVEAIERAEVVRGPASVLYGTDAIGGVLNLIGASAPLDGVRRIAGELGYRYSSHDRQARPTGAVMGRLGRLGFRASATYRDTEAYSAPAGTFGGIRLSGPVRVHDTGVQDANYVAEIAAPLGRGQRVAARLARYDARRAGFGYVSGEDLGVPNAPLIRIRYPWQRFEQLSLRYGASSVGMLVADRLDVTGYVQSNARQFTLDVFAPLGPGAPPGAGVSSISRNYTDLDTWGIRVEAAKVVGGHHVVTYGVDYFTDVSFNTDSTRTTVTGLGPPQTRTSSTPSVPNATFRSGGAFVQAALQLAPRLGVTLGGRVQDVRAGTRFTPGLTAAPVSSVDQTMVGTANLRFEVTRHLAVVGSVGRGFRSPNLVERFFDGPTPEGSGYQIRNPALEPETSVSVDVGAKYRSGALYLEAFYYRNTITNGIRIAPTGERVGPFPAFRNVNLDRLREQGLEALVAVQLASGVGLRAGYSHYGSEDALQPENPVGDTFSSKLTGELGYDDPADRFWLRYWVRYNGVRKDVDLGSNILGPVLPAFAVQGAGAGARLFRHGRLTHSVTVNLDNLGNRLYAEFPNAAFFRPEPGRSVAVTYRLAF